MMTHTSATLLRRIRELSAPLAPLPTGATAVVDPLPGIRVVAFDFYGTLFVSASGDIDPAREQPALMEAALPSAGFALQGPAAGRTTLDLLNASIRKHHEERKQQDVTYPEVDIRECWQDVLSGLAEQGHLAGTIDDGSAARVAIEYECRANPVWPMPGLDRVLAHLNHRGLLLGMISNAQFYTPLIFEALTGQSLHRAGWNPDLLVWSFDRREAKPSRGLFDQFMAQAQRSGPFEPAQVLFVGNDMLKDMLPAHQAGMRTALFAGDGRSLRERKDDPRCRDIRPERVLTDLRQLEQILVA